MEGQATRVTSENQLRGGVTVGADRDPTQNAKIIDFAGG